jgi:hypothetical protein
MCDEGGNSYLLSFCPRCFGVRGIEAIIEGGIDAFLWRF